MKLKTRFIILISIVIFTLGAIGVYTHYSFQKILSISNIHTKVHELRIQSLELTKHENNFQKMDLVKPLYFETGESKNITNFRQTYLSAKRNCLYLIESPLIESAGLKNRIQNSKSLLDQYFYTFNAFEKEKREFGFKDWGVIGKMRQSIHDVEKEINNQNKPLLKVHMLMLRRHEKDYLLRRDLKYKTKFLNEYSLFLNSLNNSALTISTKKNLQQLLNDYRSSFVLLIEKDIQTGTKMESGIMAELTNISEKTSVNINTINSIITQKVEKYVNHVIILLILFILIASTIAALFTLFVFRGITGLMGGEPEDVALIAKNVAEGNLKIDIEKKEKAKGMMKSVLEMTERLTEIIIGINLHANQIVKSTSIFSQTSSDISTGSFTQTSSIDKISSTIEQIGVNIQNNTESAKETELLAQIVKRDIHKIKEQADKSLVTSKTISEKLNVINTITMQTTILALNASVEAARAGKNGLGFHVIAEEVKRLAQTSKDAAQEINALTDANQAQTSIVNQLVSEILDPIDKTSEVLKNIKLSSEEQSLGTTLVSKSITELYNVSQANSATSQEMAANSIELEKQAERLKETIAFFITDQSITLIKKKTKKKKKSKDIEKNIKRWKKKHNTRMLIRV